ncbi:MAG: hypothetical protein RLW87_09445 [Alphaproteobacteria bacterium]
MGRWSRWLVPRLFARRDYIFVAALPKSGSTLLNNALIRLTGHFPHPLCDHHLHEQNIMHSRLIDSWGFRSIATQHTLATPLNVDYLGQFGIRPVVLVRDIFDAAVSLRDHTQREALATATFLPPPGYPAMNDAEKLDAIVDLALPWHLSFVASWQAAPLDVLTISYEEMMRAPQAVLVKVLNHIGLPDLQAETAAAWQGAASDDDTRRNVGRIGRGRAEFSAEQTERLRGLTARYPETDFSIIGLD